MGTIKQREHEKFDGGPLAVCVNDCQLDFGQANSELARICFQVRCAFAEMRWGCSPAAASNAISSVVDESKPSAGQSPGL